RLRRINPRTMAIANATTTMPSTTLELIKDPIPTLAIHLPPRCSESSHSLCFLGSYRGLFTKSDIFGSCTQRPTRAAQSDVGQRWPKLPQCRIQTRGTL